MIHSHQLDKERLVSVIHEHWMVYAKPLIICVLLFIVSAVFFTIAVMNASQDQLFRLIFSTFGFLLLLLTLHGFFLILLSESVSQVVITTKRVVRFHDILLYHKEMMEITFDKMKTVEAKKHGILQSLLNYGTLHFEGDKALVHYVPHPDSVVRDIEQAMGML